MEVNINFKEKTAVFTKDYSEDPEFQIQYSSLLDYFKKSSFKVNVLIDLETPLTYSGHYFGTTVSGTPSLSSSSGSAKTTIVNTYLNSAMSSGNFNEIEEQLQSLINKL